MTKEQYERLAGPFRRNWFWSKAVGALDRGLTLLVFAAYPLLLLYLLLGGRPRELLLCFVIPAVSFAAVSVFRKIYSAPRPYEKFEIEPLIPKETAGKSFPSRHVFSVFIIGMTYFYICPVLGIIIGVIGVLMAFVRVVGGVHFPVDVAAGAAAGILFGMLYYMF